MVRQGNCCSSLCFLRVTRNTETQLQQCMSIIPNKRNTAGMKLKDTTIQLNMMKELSTDFKGFCALNCINLVMCLSQTTIVTLSCSSSRMRDH